VTVSLKPIETIMRTAPVIPVLVIHDASHAGALAEALVKGGLRVLEVTMRTPAALDAIREMKQVEGAIVGAGTVVNTEQFEAVMKADAEFIVSPGLTERLGQVVVDSGVPFLPGVATAGDIMRGLDLGLEHFKFFPAETSGGLKALKALAAPFYQAKFCPTGGITATSAPEWLAFEPILCVGGSWVTPGGASMAEIEALAREAATLAR
jgi:2-dehydro-3-deoxyphosphogluconate aldolase/(4S)-4-hydroxy-2-oxoglutarate aldolase